VCHCCAQVDALFGELREKMTALFDSVIEEHRDAAPTKPGACGVAE
jgi:hypothetical protein